MSFYAYIYVDATSTLSGLVSFGITSNVSTNPAGGSGVVTPINTGVYLTTGGVNTMSYSPTFTFTVTTSAYYYSYMSKPVDGTLSGNAYVIGVRTTSIARVG